MTPAIDPQTAAPHAPTPGPALELDHLGLIVADIAVGREFLAQALGITRWSAVTEDPVLRVIVQFGAAPGSAFAFELIAPLGEASPIANALRQGKNILNHVAYLTDDLEASAAHLRATGCYAAGDPLPALAYDGRRIQFWISPLRFIVELIEKPGHRHHFIDPSFPGEAQP